MLDLKSHIREPLCKITSPKRIIIGVAMNEQSNIENCPRCGECYHMGWKEGQAQLLKTVEAGLMTSRKVVPIRLLATQELVEVNSSTSTNKQSESLLCPKCGTKRNYHRITKELHCLNCGFSWKE